MNVNQHIYSFLNQNDFVSISGLGAFSVNYQSAILEKNKGFNPPSKEISFSQNHIAEDDTFAQYISQKNNLPLEKVKSEIKDFSQQVLETLEKFKVYNIPDLGNLSYDSDSKEISFTIDENQDPFYETFGLESLNGVKPIRKKVKFKGQKNGSRSWKRIFWLILLLLLLAFLGFVGWDYTQTQKQNNASISLASAKNYLSNFSFKEKFSWLAFWNDKPAPINPKDSTNNILKLDSNQSNAISTLASVDTNSVDSSSTNVSEKNDLEQEKPNENKESKEEEVKPKTPQFFIIGGTFSSRKNAQKYVLAKAKQGFSDAKVIGKNDRNQYLVSLKGFVNRDDAVIALTDILNNTQIDARIVQKADIH